MLVLATSCLWPIPHQPPTHPLTSPPAPHPGPAPAESYAALAAAYFRSALVLAAWVGCHQFFLEAVFTAGVTGAACRAF